MGSGNILDVWRFTAVRQARVHVIPDGCQDVIFSREGSAEPRVHLSPLYHQTIGVTINSGTEMMGFRLRPGCALAHLDVPGLVSSIHSIAELTAKIESAAHTDKRLSEALSCIRQSGISIQHSAGELGVSVRTLQRLLRRGTRQSPSFWLRLARSRQCARALIKGGSYPDIALRYHYADQAHMCREIKHWFGVTPSQLSARDDLIAQLCGPGY